MDEYLEMVEITKPKFFIPIYGPFRSKRRYLEAVVEQGLVPRANTANAENGSVISLTESKMEIDGEEVPHGTVLVDQTGAIVSNIVVKDRVLLSEEGLVAIILTIDKKNGALLTSPDIISRGFIYMRDNEELMNNLRQELRRAVQQRFKRIDLDRFKAELKDHITHFLFEQTQRSPIVIPVVNVVGGGTNPKNDSNNPAAPVKAAQSPEDIAQEQERRFKEMRERLLTQDARVD
jgi:ribonuclease J